jgi:hypothetical protein
MGIIVGDTINFQNGLSVTDAYLSFGNSDLRVEKNGDNYSVRGVAKCWKDKACRDANLPILDLYSVTITLTKAQLDTTNLYDALYTELKTRYTTTTNEE